MNNSEHYIILREWMMQEHELSLAEAVVYAYIYGRAGKKACRIGSKKLLVNEILNMLPPTSARSVYRHLLTLERRHLIAFDLSGEECLFRAYRRPVVTELALDLQAETAVTQAETQVTERETAVSEIETPVSAFPQTPIYKDNNKEKREESERTHTHAISEIENPVWEDVVKYAAERKIATSVAKNWFLHRSSFGWQVKGQPIVNWRADLSRWNQNEPRMEGASEGRRLEAAGAERSRNGGAGQGNEGERERGGGGDHHGVVGYSKARKEPGPPRLQRDIELDRRREADYQRFEQERKTPGWEERIDRICERITRR